MTLVEVKREQLRLVGNNISYRRLQGAASIRCRHILIDYGNRIDRSCFLIGVPIMSRLLLCCLMVTPAREVGAEEWIDVSIGIFSRKFARRCLQIDNCHTTASRAAYI